LSRLPVLVTLTVVLIAWVTPEENPDFATDVAGEAGSARVAFPGRPTVYVTGQVELDAAKLSSMLAQPDGQGQSRAVIQHELGLWREGRRSRAGGWGTLRADGPTRGAP
jgi:hypothetical protein